MYKDKDKQLQYQRDWYKRNKDRHVANVRKNEVIYKDISIYYIKSYLGSHPCVDCGESDWIVLEFDHVRGIKSYNVSALLNRGQSLDHLKEEIAKCDVRCANCHRKATAKRGNFYRNNLA